MKSKSFLARRNILLFRPIQAFSLRLSVFLTGFSLTVHVCLMYYLCSGFKGGNLIKLGENYHQQKKIPVVHTQFIWMRHCINKVYEEDRDNRQSERMEVLPLWSSGAK